MRYSKAQLNAISRSYTARNQARLQRIAEENGLLTEFYTQKKYKTLGNFLKSKAENGKINGEYV